MNYVKYLRDMVGHKPVILVGSVTIIHQDNKILLQKRRIGGKWGLLGGLMELGESTEETARREALEEANLTLGHLNLVTVHSGKDAYIKVDNGDEFYCVATCYECSEVTGSLYVDPEESYEIKYFDKHHLPSNLVASHKFMIDVFLEKS